MTHQERLDYVNGLKLGLPKAVYTRRKRSSGAADANADTMVKDGEQQNFFADKGLYSFVANVSEQNRKDVLNSVLLAQMVANEKVPDENEAINWYKVFLEVLEKIGWFVESKQVSEFISSKDIVEVQNAIVKILKDAFGENYIGLLKSALDSIKDLSDSDGKIKAFEKNTHGTNKGCFQVGIAYEQNGSVAFNLGTFILSTKSNITRILFVNFGSDKTELQYSSSKATLNNEVFQVLRNTVVQKLANDGASFLAKI